MDTKERYANAYREVIEVLKYTKKEDVRQIPKEQIKLWYDNMNKDYDFKIDPNKTLEEQNLSVEAKAVIFNAFKKYWATDYQKKIIEEQEKIALQQLEDEKLKMHNPSEIFSKQSYSNTKEKNVENNGESEIVEESVALEEVKKESIFQKIANFFKGIFKSN